MINFKQYPQIERVYIPDSINCNPVFNKTFTSMKNLSEVKLHENVTDMIYTFASCTNLTTAVCGTNVTNMTGAYNVCSNLTTAVCGDSVVDMSWTYGNCTNLTTAVCGDNVSNMAYAYVNCTNLTTAVCGNNVANMVNAYGNCTNLTTAVCGASVTNMAYAYRACNNIQGNAYFYSPSISSVRRCFIGKNNSHTLNIYVPSNTTTNTTVHCANSYSLRGSTITWTDAGTYQYNATYNIYIYPVANVEEARIANGD